MSEPCPQTITEDRGDTAALAPDHVDWVEIRCHLCGKIRGKIIAYPILDGVRNSAKFGIEAWCKNCKVLTYKTIVV